MKKTFLAFSTALIIVSHSFGQVYTNKEVGKKNEALIDSIKVSEYPYSLPIWGAKVTVNKHFMLRAEVGFLGSRQQFMTGIQYRFGM